MSTPPGNLHQDEVAWLLPTAPKHPVAPTEAQSEVAGVWWAAERQAIRQSAWSNRAPVPEDCARQRLAPVPAAQPSAPIASHRRPSRRFCTVGPEKAASERRRAAPLSPPAHPQNGKRGCSALGSGRESLPPIPLLLDPKCVLMPKLPRPSGRASHAIPPRGRIQTARLSD